MQRTFPVHGAETGTLPASGRLVVSLTSIPSRLGMSLERTLWSVTTGQKRQPDRVYLGLPMRSARGDAEPTEYTLPSFLHGDLTMPERFGGLVRIIRLPFDHGPVCKLLAGLQGCAEDGDVNPESRIVVCDDDVEYGPLWLSELDLHSQIHTQAAVGFGAFDVLRGLPFFRMRFGGLGKGRPQIPYPSQFSKQSLPRNVDCLMGIGGALYRRRYFPAKTLQELLEWTKHPRWRRADDILISAAISKQGIARVLVAPSDAAEHANLDLAGANPLSSSKALAVYNHVRAFSSLQRSAGAFPDSHSFIPVEVCWIAILTAIVITFVISVLFLLRFTERHVPRFLNKSPLQEGAL